MPSTVDLSHNEVPPLVRLCSCVRPSLTFMEVVDHLLQLVLSPLLSLTLRDRYTGNGSCLCENISRVHLYPRTATCEPQYNAPH